MFFVSSYCFYHIAFKKTQKSGESAIKNEPKTATKSKKSHKLVQNPAFESSTTQGESSASSHFLAENKHILSEPKFLLNNSNERITANRKQLHKDRKNPNGPSKKSKKSFLAIDVETNSEERSDENNSSDEDDCFEENYMLKNDSDLENDMDLLDPSDSLDQTMFNLINAKKLSDLSKLDTKKLSLHHSTETNELLLVDFGDGEEEEETIADELLGDSGNEQHAPSAPISSKNKLIEKNIESDYDFLLRFNPIPTCK